MNRIEAEDYIYESYMRAEKEWKYEDKDAIRRNPQLSLRAIRALCVKPAITVTGSKGKGSVANMISRILASSMKVGLMTSPHVINFNERFQIMNLPIDDSEFIRYAEKTKAIFAEVQVQLEKGECISPIGIQCVLALLFFNDNNTDINIFECGKGVKYDDVNNIPHAFSVINTIFLEHTRELGNSLREIAENKACIITGNEKCVYVAEQKEEVYQVLAKRADEMHTQMKVYGRDFYASNIRFTKQGMQFDVVIGERIYEDICIPLLGEHQAKNCALALALCTEIIDVSIKWQAIKDNLACMEWPGRMEIISNEPFVLLDACINRESAYNVVDIVRKVCADKVVTIIGIPDDKDYQGVAMEMSKVSEYIILTKSSNRHYVFSDQQVFVLERCLMKSDLSISATQDVLSALRLAIKKNRPIVIVGTTSLIADIKRIDMSEVIKYV